MHISKYNNTSGNVLFLILIAVALFAALSYAVTSSSRSGGGNASKETTETKAMQLLQTTAAMRTGVQRMVMSGINITDLKFNSPANFATCPSPRVCVFHPSGGGVSYPRDSGVSGMGYYNGMWVFNMDWELSNIGINGVNGNELIAFSLDIDKAVCEAVNKKLGLPYNPLPGSGNQRFSPEEISLSNMDNTYTAPASASYDLSGAAGLLPLVGKYEGCYLGDDTDEEYVYYAVLIAR